MNITRLKLLNYRNYNEVNIELDKGLNLIVGENAQGKTNILESIYYCCHAKSYRTSKDEELIKFDKEYFYIEADIENNRHQENLKLSYNKMKDKNILINDLKVKKLSELVGFIKVITFKPEDLSIIKDGPAERRKHFDSQISQINPKYLDYLQKYNKVLLQKNNYLKKTYSPNENEIEIWNEQLLRYGIEIIKIRREYIDKINTKIAKIHKNMTNYEDCNETIKLEYEENITIDNYEEELKNNISNDIQYKSSYVGPHKDDYSFYINEQNVKKYGSQGQQRTTILSLKFSEMKIIEEETEEKPIILLDDVMSELDEYRQSRMLEYVKNHQTIITGTEIKSEVLDTYNEGKIFYIKNGDIKASNNQA